MEKRVLRLITCLAALAACSSSSGSDPGNGGGSSSTSSGGSGGATMTEHGIVYDYGTLLTSGTLATVSGLTVTDGDQTTTTDDQGGWTLTVPIDGIKAPVITGTSKGDPYSYLVFPQVTAAGSDIDWGNIIMPDQSTFSLERVTLGSSDAQAVVHVVVQPTGSCTSIAGGTMTVTSPPGAKVNYFDAPGYPRPTQTSFIDPPVPGRPVADIYDVAAGAQITFTVSHPSCHQVPYPVTYKGGTFSGQVTTMAAEPGDNNSALVVVLE